MCQSVILFLIMLEKQRSTIADMKKEKQNLEKINCELEAKVKKFVRTEQHTMLESNMLRSKLKTLEEKLALCHIAEKPYDKPKDEQTNHKAYSVETWEEIKKWQQMVSKLKSKLSTKEVECTSLEKNLATAKSVILRLENEKATLEKKGKQVQHNRVESSSNNYEAFNQLYSSTCALEDEVCYSNIKEIFLCVYKSLLTLIIKINTLYKIELDNGT